MKGLELNGIGDPLMYVDWKLFLIAEFFTVLIEVCVVYGLLKWDKTADKIGTGELVVAVVLANIASAVLLSPIWLIGFGGGYY